MKDPLVEKSKFLAYVLRHRPDEIGLSMDDAGWVAVDQLLAQSNAHGQALTREELDRIVREDAKGRYSFSEDGLRVRARQGHSVAVDGGWREAAPPAVLFHGTVAKAYDSIRARGLEKMQRHHVHLCADAATARGVGSRRGKPVVLTIAAGKMVEDGYRFFLSENGVWLTDHVPPHYITSYEAED